MLTEQQIADRRLGVGGSDIPIILGLSSYMTPYQLYLEKLGLLSTERVETPNQYWGHKIEPLIREEFAKRNNVTIEERINRTHPILTFLRGNLDGWIKEWDRVFEAKCSIMSKASEWSHVNPDGVPLEYLAQNAHYCIIENAKGGNFGVLIGGYDYREFRYERDKKLEDKLIEAASKFMECVEKQEPLPPINEQDLLLMYPQHADIKIMADTTIMPRVKELKEVKKRQKEIEELERAARFDIMSYMATADCLISEDEQELVTWRTNKRGSRVFLVKQDKEDKNNETRM